METLYVIVGLTWAIISIIMVVKFFQMSSDLKALRNHFMPIDNPKGEKNGVIESNGISYTVINGSVKFSDDSVGYIRSLKSGKYSVNIDKEDKIFDDVHSAAEALYDYRSKK